MDIDQTTRRMKYAPILTMKRISLFSSSLIASIIVLSACAQSTVSVRPTEKQNETSAGKSKTTAVRQYEPISLNEPYYVKPGDTLYGISFRAGLSYRDLAIWNNIPEPYTVKIGQRIVLRTSEIHQAENTSAIVAPPAAVIAQPNPIKPVEVKPSAVAPIIVTPIVSTPILVAPVVTTATKPVVQTPIIIAPEKPALTTVIEPKPVHNSVAMSWRWPSEGSLIARFVQGDTTQQGINIGGKSGQSIHASADGTVVYSGAGLVGYGELIIIKHNNEWLSAYAHSRRRLVAEGTKVKAGDVIAEMGRSGTMRDMLHFEIRRNGKPVDPLLYLPKQ